ncbi:MAG: endonuclease domain-containing protein [Chitinophagales bacterium]
MKSGTYSNNNYNKQLKPYAGKLRKEMTKAEACLWKYVLRAGLMKGYTFRRQRPILNFIADFVCLDLKMVIEVDGLTHNFEEVIEKDKRKELALQEAGFTVLRFTDAEVLNQIESVRNTIANWIEQGNFRPGKHTKT